MSRLKGLAPTVHRLAPQVSQSPTDEGERSRYRDKTQHWRAWYKTARWRRRRAQQLRLQPLCEWCNLKSLIVPATIAHHTTPHRGDERLFFEGDLTSLCEQCHNSEAQGLERRGRP